MDKSKWSMIKLTHVKEADGNLMCLEQNKEIPFNIERIFMMFRISVCVQIMPVKIRNLY